MFSAVRASPLLQQSRRLGAAALSTAQVPRLLQLNDLQNLPGSKRKVSAALPACPLLMLPVPACRG